MKKTPVTKAAILKTLRAHDENLKKFSVRRIGLFGSFARNAQRNNSDVDLVVEFDEPTYVNFYGLSVYLEKLLRRRVQILTPDAIDSIRVEEVAQGIKESVVYV
ncbi:MAG TPA: nucleotidyltransferase domain-containing protein [Vicinamibacterales bacterium]|nr:nucleotidyltransferase domain-containing protein [Vicinamibacterales bacterium]